MIYQAIYSLILTAAGATTEVSPADGSDRAKHPSSLPAVRHKLISEPRPQADGSVTSRYQVDIFATTVAAARAIAASIRTALDGYAGTTASTAIQNIRIAGKAETDRPRFANAVARLTLDAYVTYTPETIHIEL